MSGLAHVFDLIAPHTARPLGCECGAGLHEGETHEAALAAEAVEASTACDCGGYFVDGEVLHDGKCPLSDWGALSAHGVDPYPSPVQP